MKRFAVLAYRLRQKLRLTQVEMAERMKISQTAVSRYEKGQSFPNGEVLARYCDYAAVPISAVLSDEQQPGPRRGRAVIEREFGVGDWTGMEITLPAAALRGATRAVAIHDDSADDLFPPGTILLVEPFPTRTKAADLPADEPVLVELPDRGLRVAVPVHRVGSVVLRLPSSAPEHAGVVQPPVQITGYRIVTVITSPGALRL